MNVPNPLSTDNTVLLLIDFQERLFPVMHDKEKLLRNVVKLIKGVKVLEIPIILTEQYPKGLGPTVLEIKELLPDVKPIEKVCFNCCDEESFCRSLESLKRRQALIAGIEAHICVYQTRRRYRGQAMKSRCSATVFHRGSRRISWSPF